MKTLVAGISTLVLGLAVAHGADTSVVPPQHPSNDPAQPTQPLDTNVEEQQSYDRQTDANGNVREQKRIDRKSKADKKIEEKTTY